MLFLLILLFAVISDQISKYYAEIILKDGKVVNIIGDFFKFEYVQNRGAAFGVLQGRKIFFFIITIVTLSYIAYMVCKYYGEFTILQKVFFAFFTGGIIGNFIDRIFRGYVIDFISFRLFDKYDFPVFNLADSYMVISIFMFMIYFIYMFIKAKRDNKNGN